MAATSGNLQCEACAETPLTYEDIDVLDNDDIVEAIIMADEHQTPVDGLTELEEFKMRLRLHVKMVLGGSIKDKLDGAIKAIGDRDAEKRVRLSQMVSDVKKMFSNDQLTTRLQLMEGLLSQDGTTANIRTDCDRSIASLQSNECSILVSGESSAGKSSLLNLLFNDDILPQHMLPCTSAVTVVKYGDVASAKIFINDGSCMDIPALDTAGLEQLHNIAFIKEAGNRGDGDPDSGANIAASVYEKRREGHNIQEIQVYLPLQFLKGGLVLVDTPGVGENEFLETYLMDYIANHTILGFMYIIMADNALGVAEDRLINLMTLVIKQQKASSDLIRFDPNSVLFVGNRWDMVDVESRSDFRDNILKKLEKCWPEFDKSRTIFFSTKNARQEADLGFVNDDYEKLLRAVQKLVDTSVDRRIKASYKWLGNVLQRSLHYVKTMARQLEMSDQGRIKKVAFVNRKLRILKQKSAGVIATLKADAECAVKEICLKLREFLKNPTENRPLLQRWGEKQGELPDMSVASGTWDWVKRQLDAAFDSRLLLLIYDWDKREQTIPTLEKHLARDARLNLCELESDLAVIENNVHGESRKTVEGDYLSSSMILNNLCNSLPDFAEAALIETTNVPNRMKISLSRLIKKIKPSGKEHKLKKYIKDPKAVATECAQRNLKELLDENGEKLEWFVRQFMQRPFAYIRSLESKIPALIRCNENLLTSFKEQLDKESQSRAEYVSMILNIEGIRRGMLEYSEDFLFANDFQNEDVVLVRERKHAVLAKKESLRDMMSMANQTNCSYKHGLWTIVYHGYLKTGGHDCDVAVRLYDRHSGIENTFLEIAKLRCLLHQDVCIAEFLGIYQHTESPYPALIYAGHLLSVQKYRADHPDHNVSKMMTEMLAGLQYIHSKGLVHMELTQETVTVSADGGEVKLTGACQPRVAKLPDTSTENVRAGGYVYLAPEVLHGHCYTAWADIYAFALMSIELLSSSNVFTVESGQTLSEFINTVNASEKLSRTINNLQLSDSTKQCLTGCLHGIRERRPEITSISMEFRSTDSRQSSIYSLQGRSESIYKRWCQQSQSSQRKSASKRWKFPKGDKLTAYDEVDGDESIWMLRDVSSAENDLEGQSKREAPASPPKIDDQHLTYLETAL